MKAIEILLIEDTPIHQKVACALLAGDYYQVTVAGSGQDAINRSSSTQYDLILLDMSLPDMAGLDAWQQIQQNSLNACTPVVAMSGTMTDAVVAECKALGIHLALTKPLEANVLIATIEQALLNALPNQANISTEKNANVHLVFNKTTYSWLEDNLSQQDIVEAIIALPVQYDHMVDSAKKAWLAGDESMTQRLMHKLAGSASQLGLEKLSQQAWLLEQSTLSTLKPSNFQDLSELCHESINCLAKYKGLSVQ